MPDKEVVLKIAEADTYVAESRLHFARRFMFRVAENAAYIYTDILKRKAARHNACWLAAVCNSVGECSSCEYPHGGHSQSMDRRLVCHDVPNRMRVLVLSFCFFFAQIICKRAFVNGRAIANNGAILAAHID